MDKEKMNGIELSDEELKQVSGGSPGHETQYVLCSWMFNTAPCCNLLSKGQLDECATCRKNN